MAEPKIVYIAGGFRSGEFVRKVMDFAEKLGFVIGRDWTAHPFTNRLFNPKEAMIFSRADSEAIKASDYFLLLADTMLGSGTHTELGIAYALGKSIYVAGSAAELKLFYFLPGIQRRASWKTALCQMVTDGNDPS